jgi:hypothetical protein
MIGKTMRCSSAMVLPVRHFKAPELVPITRVAQVNGPGKRKKERCLSYDEKPLLLFQKLKHASRNPVFMLKHIKDIRSPREPLLNRSELRARRQVTLYLLNLNPLYPTHGHPRARLDYKCVRMHPMLSSASAQPGWPDVMSTATDSKDRKDSTDRERSKGANGSGPPKSAVLRTASGSTTSDHNEIGTPAREVPVSAEISYAVAVYPYMAEQEDEFDVVVYVPQLLPSHGLC